MVAGPGRCVLIRSKPMMMYYHSIDIAAEAHVKEEEDNAKVYTHAVYIRLSLLELRAVEFSSGLQTVVYNEQHVLLLLFTFAAAHPPPLSPTVIHLFCVARVLLHLFFVFFISISFS